MSGTKRTFVTPLDAVRDNDDEGLGTIRQENGKFYKWVQYKEGSGTLDVAAGDFVGYTDYSANQVTPDASDTDNVGAGVMQAAVTADAKYCWIQIKGEASLNTNATGSAGNLMKFSADKTLAAVAAHADVGVAMALNGTVDSVILDCPF